MTLSIRVGGATGYNKSRSCQSAPASAGCSSVFWPPHSPACVCRLSSGPALVLVILCKWGKHHYHPRPSKIVLFDVICPLLIELRQWTGPTGNIIPVKVKSHTRCLMYERAGELAELGRAEEEPVLYHGQQKYGSFWLRIRPSTREYEAKSGKSLPKTAPQMLELYNRWSLSMCSDIREQECPNFLNWFAMVCLIWRWRTHSERNLSKSKAVSHSTKPIIS